ncbi:hypothetical protein FA95DRAFT_1614182 [Auriscalpium vulgare]|uniref:Uncharacterized protein n=1 Tax=Auriscalpium vulgare TaxID=40419 RepID=A0ACB8R051_9AGAM|nr:hypothetical protein FA95DRAFT_1614182 [Auriscalpium vulgare]
MAQNYWQTPYSLSPHDAPNFSKSPTLSVESLGLEELMKNPHFLDLYRSQLSQSRELVRLNQEVSRLNNEIRNSDASSRASSSRASTPFSKELTPATAPEMPALRPQKYPFSILWNKEDCREDDDSGCTDSNPHRPPMRSCVRNIDGTMIDPQKFRTIRNSARIVKADLLAALPVKEKTKTHSLGYFPNATSPRLVR